MMTWDNVRKKDKAFIYCLYLLLPPALRVVLSQLWHPGQVASQRLAPPRKTYNLHWHTISQVSQSRHPFWLCHVLLNMVAWQFSPVPVSQFNLLLLFYFQGNCQSHQALTHPNVHLRWSWNWTDETFLFDHQSFGWFKCNWLCQGCCMSCTQFRNAVPQLVGRKNWHESGNTTALLHRNFSLIKMFYLRKSHDVLNSAVLFWCPTLMLRLRSSFRNYEDKHIEIISAKKKKHCTLLCMKLYDETGSWI